MWKLKALYNIHTCSAAWENRVSTMYFLQNCGKAGRLRADGSEQAGIQKGELHQVLSLVRSFARSRIFIQWFWKKGDRAARASSLWNLFCSLSHTQRERKVQKQKVPLFYSSFGGCSPSAHRENFVSRAARLQLHRDCEWEFGTADMIFCPRLILNIGCDANRDDINQHLNSRSVKK